MIISKFWPCISYMWDFFDLFTLVLRIRRVIWDRQFTNSVQIFRLNDSVFGNESFFSFLLKLC